MIFTKDLKLTSGEMAKSLGIGRDTWARRKEEILANMEEQGIKYKITTKGKSIVYHFLSEGEFNYVRKSKKKTEQRDKVFEEEIISVIQKHPLNTPANISRIIAPHESVANLGYTDSTVYEYTRQRIRMWFGKEVGDIPPAWDNIEYAKRKGYIKRKVWCYRDYNTNLYVPLTEDEINDFISMIKQGYKEIQQTDIQLLADLDAGLITKEEYKEQSGDMRIFNYSDAKASFESKYGYTPIKVPMLALLQTSGAIGLADPCGSAN